MGTSPITHEMARVALISLSSGYGILGDYGVNGGPGSGFGAGKLDSASAGNTIGVFKSIDAAKGPYLEAGGSVGYAGSSVGLDFCYGTKDVNKFKLIGLSFTGGISAGSLFELHGKIGGTWATGR